MSKYQDFLKSKKIKYTGNGINESELLSWDFLYDFQKKIVNWALTKGRAAVFADCGLGKTPIQLAWASNVCQIQKGNVLILAPLAVSQQTIKEGEKFGVDINYCRKMEDVKPGITITNYEMLKNFDASKFIGIVLDESSILKSFDGKYKQQIIDAFQETPFRLACTATPAPNDILEIANHAEFLGIMNQKEMIALFFIQDGNTSKEYRLKNHAIEDFWAWMASWSVALRDPSDLGFEDNRFQLPKLNIEVHTIKDGTTLDDYLLPIKLDLNQARRLRKKTIGQRVDKCKCLIGQSEDPWLVWCDLNDEGDALKTAINGSIEVRGSDSIETKEDRLLGFSSGKYTRLVTKPSIAGFGLNWQHCSNVIFCGLSYSYEQFYQSIRRCWRFGQTKDVNVHIVIHENEKPILDSVMHKQRKSKIMMDEIIERFRFYQIENKEEEIMSIEERETTGDGWKMLMGDCIERVDELEDESIGFSIFSPPFPAMYAYTDSNADIGNVKNMTELINHFRFLAEKLLLKLMPGRNVAVHLTQMPAFKRDYDYVGLKDFRGEVIRMFEAAGWIYYSEACIDKCPQVKAIRTKDSTLTFKGLASDSSKCRPAMADYLLIFRKKGDNPAKIRSGNIKRYNNPDGWIKDTEWIEWAHPVWYGIKEPDVLNYREGRDSDDEKHLCPLQLEVIKRGVLLWTNPGETVFSPFAGIGSEGYVSIKEGRKFIGIELKESYYKTACKNLTMAETVKENKQDTLFAM